MSAEGYAEFLRRIGHNVRASGEHFWFDSQRGVYQPFPVDLPVDPQQIDLRAILKRDGWLARYPCSLEGGRRSFRLAVDPNDYGLSRLSTKARNQTRRGLERCKVRPVEPSMLRTRGVDINADTLGRQGRSLDSASLEYWRKYFHEVSPAVGAEVWGAYVGDELAAFLIAFRMNACAHIFIMRSARDFLPAYPNNALLFSYISMMAGDPVIKEVSIGLEPIQPELDTLNHFKYGMGFREVPIGQRIDLVPWLRPVADSIASAWLCKLARRVKNERVEKIAGLIEWYRCQPRLAS